MNLISTFAPETFLKPVLVISTVFADGIEGGITETAVCFVEALNGQHALSIIYGDKSEHGKKTDFIPIQQHKTLTEALKYHDSLAKVLRNGCSKKKWALGTEKYFEIYHRFYPKELLTTSN